MGAYESDMQSFDMQLVEVAEEGRVGQLLTSVLLNSIRNQVEIKYLANIIQPEQEMSWDGVMIYRRYRNEEIKARDTDIFRDSDLSNSFFADDLRMVEQAISGGEFGKNPMEQAILDYMTGVYAEESPELHWLDLHSRIDVRGAWKNGLEEERADFFHRHLDIAKAPLGKWPSKFMPCLMQQLAVNLSWCPSLDNQPIFSVNGPPGTGKTTLLKEIIAGNVVERANLLVQYQDPDDAFIQRRFQDGSKTYRGYSQYCWGYYDFAAERLKDYGMLVASCNNAAVENITKELPDGTALLKGMEPGKKENESVRRSLLEVQHLFRQMEQELQQISGARKCFVGERASLRNEAQRIGSLEALRQRNAEEMLKELQDLAQQLRLAEQTLKDYQTELAGLRQRKFLQDENQANAENQIQKLRQQIYVSSK